MMAAAVTGLVTGAAVARDKKVTKSHIEKHACRGKNSCKGNGGCKENAAGCKAKNDCKGKGGCATDGKKHNT